MNSLDSVMGVTCCFEIAHLDTLEIVQIFELIYNITIDYDCFSYNYSQLSFCCQHRKVDDLKLCQAIAKALHCLSACTSRSGSLTVKVSMKSSAVKMLFIFFRT